VDPREYRKRAEECVRVAQNAKPHHRAFLLEIASKWLELSAHDQKIEAELSTGEPPSRPAN